MNKETPQEESKKSYFEENKDALLEEYRQLHESVRHDSRVQLWRENIITPLAFAPLVLAFSYADKLDVPMTIFICAVSILLYAYIIGVCETARFYRHIKQQRIAEIEEESGCMKTEEPYKNAENFERVRREYFKREMERVVGRFKWIESVSMKFAKLSNRRYRLLIGFTLILGWIAFFVFFSSGPVARKEGKVVTADITIYIIGTLLMAFVAIVGEKIRLWLWRPKLRVSIRMGPPDCHKTTVTAVKKGISSSVYAVSSASDPASQSGPATIRIPCYYYRLLIENIGKSKAEEVEVIVSNLRKKNMSNSNYQSVNDFMPLNLRWSFCKDGENVEKYIARSTSKHCDLLYILEPTETAKYYGVVESTKPMQIRFDTVNKPNNLVWCQEPGEYKATIKVASANASLIERELKITCNGKWYDDERNMLSQGCIVTILN